MRSMSRHWLQCLLGASLAALAAFAIQHYLYPAKKQFLQYTTTSPVMQKRLGVPH